MPCITPAPNVSVHAAAVMPAGLPLLLAPPLLCPACTGRAHPPPPSLVALCPTGALWHHSAFRCPRRVLQPPAQHACYARAHAADCFRGKFGANGYTTNSALKSMLQRQFAFMMMPMPTHFGQLACKEGQAQVAQRQQAEGAAVR